ncbi:hypothetical protein BAE46_00875 [Glaciecola punicea]|jgi:hypothetical protein|uniref:hypothetical protein n=1 Tax=Glaciecola punicea TaxID=56804 RepID=UPI000872D4A8|nr:hypothetical protein [Glaciecola punicea]OFA33295.1 hypothetical protein BAE46_00875 [Glaciecola punicea]
MMAVIKQLLGLISIGIATLHDFVGAANDISKVVKINSQAFHDEELLEAQDKITKLRSRLELANLVPTEEKSA